MHMAMSAIKLGDIDQALIIGEVQLICVQIIKC